MVPSLKKKVNVFQNFFFSKKMMMMNSKKKIPFKVNYFLVGYVCLWKAVLECQPCLCPSHRTLVLISTLIDLALISRKARLADFCQWLHRPGFGFQPLNTLPICSVIAYPSKAGKHRCLFELFFCDFYIFRVFSQNLHFSGFFLCFLLHFSQGFFQFFARKSFRFESSTLWPHFFLGFNRRP